MAIDARFSKTAFLGENARDPSSRRLSDELEAEVQRLLHDVVVQRVAEIVNQLNAYGHDLREYERPSPGVIALRDDLEGERGYECDLRLAVDTTVSVGFRDTIDSLAADSPEVGQ